ncbi:alpha-protein kinase vwkA-like [Xenia sp. Carnegie-2017]|uniref:alpha-protein kinase vwkA-like n=1 Tax=Xenia sp. Carnegie-2017 TaxID=2897299 RepID=UPI001F04F860|nr:alpha-protein kinase vwkA-like [Xenia sp. Carnegie-2017]
MEGKRSNTFSSYGRVNSMDTTDVSADMGRKIGDIAKTFKELKLKRANQSAALEMKAVDKLEPRRLKREQEIDRQLEVTQKAQSMNLCFLVDCTGSMSSYIKGVKEKIQEAVNKCKNMFPGFEFSVAFVGYRDHGDGDDRIVFLDFRESISEFETFVKAIVAKGGGGDRAEDVFGGIEQVTKLSWSKHTRIMLHIADAPCHGNRFHTMSVQDNYPEGDPHGLKVEDLLSKLQKMNILYWFAKIGDITNEMIEVFQSLMSIDEIDLSSADNLAKTVVGSISVSVEIMEKNVPNPSLPVVEDREFKIEERIPNWFSITAKKVLVSKFEIPDDSNNLQKELKRSTDVESNIKIAPNPFAQGRSCIAFYGKYEQDYGKPLLVLKQFKDLSKSQITSYVEKMEIRCVAVALANKFNAINPKSVGKVKLSFDQLSVATVTEYARKIHYTMERYIPGKYVKFNNSAGFVNENVYTATLSAFSHWTYCVTDGYLMVVDLQGVKDDTQYVLTDPTVHCDDVMRFGKNNLGKKGMDKFFRTHFCNFICEAMNLKSHELQP